MASVDDAKKEAEEKAAASAKSDDRLRDLIGRLASRMETLEARLEEEELMRSTYADDDPPPTNRPAPTVPPVPNSGFKTMYDPTTGKYWNVPTSVFPGSDISAAPNVPYMPPTPTHQSGISDSEDDLIMYLTDDLQYYGGMHKRDAEDAARRVVRQAARHNESVESALVRESKANPNVRTFLQSRIEANASALGGKVIFSSDAEDKGAAVASPAAAPRSTVATVAATANVANAAAQSLGTVDDDVAPEVLAAGVSTTPSSPPVVNPATHAKDAEAAASAVADKLDAKFGVR